MQSKFVAALALLASTANAAAIKPQDWTDCTPPPPPPCPSTADVSCGNEGIAFKVFEDAWPFKKLNPGDWDHTTTDNLTPAHSGVRNSLGYQNKDTPPGGLIVYKAPVYGSQPLNQQRIVIKHEFMTYAYAPPATPNGPPADITCDVTTRAPDDAIYVYAGQGSNRKLIIKQFWVTGGKAVATAQIKVKAGTYIPFTVYSGNLGGPQDHNLEVKCNGKVLVGPNPSPSKMVVHKICKPQTATIYNPNAY